MDRAKPWFIYWFWRIYVPIVWMIEGILGLLWITTLNVAYLNGFFLGMPLYIGVVIALSNRYIFTPDYNIFGKYRRTPLPKAAPLRTIGKSWESFQSWGTAGPYNMGPVVWLLYQHGIGIKTSYGNVFIRLDEIEALDMERGYDSVLLRNSTATLYHHCPEIRKPIAFPNWIAEIIAAHYPGKVLARAERV